MQETIKTLKILCNQNRIGIITLLSNKATKEQCVGEIAVHIKASQSSTSHQLAYLEAHGVVECVRMGQTMCYFLAKTKITEQLLKVLSVLK